MGYYTSYGLELIGSEEDVIAFEDDLLKSSSCADGTYDPDIKDLVESGGVFAKLYDIEDVISEVALRHTDVLVVLEGNGEDCGDLWESRWRGSEYEHQSAIIPPFKNKALQKPMNNNK